MSATSALLLVVAAWVVIGVAAGIVMGRRGHGRYVWALTGALLGPLVVPLVFASSRRVERSPAPMPAPAYGGAPSGQLDVVVGVDGSQDATGALMTALALFGPMIGRLTVAIVVDYDVASMGTPPGARESAQKILEENARRAAGVLHREPHAVVLSGQPADALAAYAREGGYDLVVVAPRGRGASRLLFGSVATTLARGVGVPVAILPPAQRRGDASSASIDGGANAPGSSAAEPLP
jgi:nucleotide-binding universal stress UspA family protein